MILPYNIKSNAFAFAQRISSNKSSPDAVITTSLPILRWLGDALDRMDLNRRHDALWSAHNGRSGVEETKGQDDVKEFLEEATAYYDAVREADELDQPVSIRKGDELVTI